MGTSSSKSTANPQQAPAAPRSSNIPPAVCRHYLKGQCRSGGNCKWQHPAANHGGQLSSRRRIDYCCKAVHDFLGVIFANPTQQGPAGDRCMFAKFSDHFEVMGFPLCYEPKLLSLANWSLPVNQPFHGHSTRLWDCIVEGIETFVKAADQKRPWLAIILTDGEDIDSQKHDMNAAAAAMAIFNRGQGNLTCVIGLGNQVGSKMEAICQATGSLYVPVAKAEILPVVFAVLALHVVKGVRIDVAKIASQDATLVLAQARAVAHVQRMPVDVMMMIDVSGSMYKN